MKYALIPAARTHRIFLVLAKHINHRLPKAQAARLCVLRHKQHITQLLFPDFLYEGRKIGGARQVQRAARLAAMPVSSRNYRPLPKLRQLHDPLVLAPVAHGVELESVEKFDVPLQKSFQNKLERKLSRPQLVPKRMVEHD